MNSNQDHKRDRLIVFGRYPVPGQTKTRLIPLLGAARAADFQRVLAERTVRTDRAFVARQGTALEACFEGCSEKKLRRWLGSGLIFSTQCAGDLGQRMETALREAFREGCHRVVLHGTDIPGLTVSHLAEAFEALREKDLVLGPSTDGGYWLIGLKQHADLFRSLEWGTSTVFAKTVAAAHHLNFSFHVLGPLTDMDTSEAVRQCMPEWAEQRPYVSVIIPTLNEAARIEESIAHARSGDAEIIVVDGGSTDDTVKKASLGGARTIKASRGRAMQQNEGAAAARGSVLLFLHADTRLPKGYVSHAFDILLHPGTILGAFRFKTDSDEPRLRIIEFLANFRSQHLRLPYGDQALFVCKAAFDRAGGFPGIPIAEDLVFAKKLSKMGRFGISEAEAVTSARRWLKLGVVRTTVINQIILAGLAMGVSPYTLSRIYRQSANRED
jgi:rSAM/selenodomain-associated transferase 2/rSAM/selenodomain-associated transferase 1